MVASRLHSAGQAARSLLKVCVISHESNECALSEKSAASALNFGEARYHTRIQLIPFTFPSDLMAVQKEHGTMEQMRNHRPVTWRWCVAMMLNSRYARLWRRNITRLA